MSNITQHVVLSEHPLEEMLDIESGTTEMVKTEYQPADTVDISTYDDKDNEIEDQFDEIYNLALSSVTDIIDQTEQVEGKYKARMHEVAASTLQVALNAAKEKAGFKQHKDKLYGKNGTTVSGDVNHTTNNIVITQAELAKQLKDLN